MGLISQNISMVQEYIEGGRRCRHPLSGWSATKVIAADETAQKKKKKKRPPPKAPFLGGGPPPGGRGVFCAQTCTVAGQRPV